MLTGMTGIQYLITLSICTARWAMHGNNDNGK